MRFLAFSPLAAYALLAGIAALIVLIYWWLRPPARPIVVSSMLIWARLLAARRRNASRWRWLISLVLALAIGLSLALALTRPEFPGTGAFGQRMVIILDDSASMAARTADGGSRWQHAVEQARGLISRAGLSGEAMVLDATGRSGAASFMGRTEALTRLARLKVSAQRAVQVPAIAQDAGAVAVHLFTDGVSLGDAPRGTQIHSVFEPADNVAITAFDARALPNDPGRWQAFVQLHNASARAKRATLSVSSEGRQLYRRAVDLQAGETADETLDVTAFAGGLMRAEIRAPNDAFDRDDVAYAIVSPHAARRVLLVTPGDSLLEDALRALPGVALTTVKPAAYRATPAFDSYVFDRFAPREAPPAGALLLKPPAAPWLPAPAAQMNDAVVAYWDEASELTAGVAWRDLRVRRAALASASDAVSIVVSAQSAARGGLVATGTARAPWIEAGFAREDSTFHLQPGFPVFLGNALGWLSERSAPLVRELGMIELPLPGAQVRDGRGALVETVRTPSGTAFEAAQPGVFSVESSGRRVQVIAAVLDRDYARINRSTLADAGAFPAGIRAAQGRWPSPWVILLLIASALLLAEWATFTRRMTL